MSGGFRGVSRAFFFLVALFAALGGTVYAAGKIDGRTIKVKSLPGNRLRIGSVPANRLQPGGLSGANLAPGSVTGAQIDVSTLGQVPSAAGAESATTAQSADHALRADSALEAVEAASAAHADSATSVNGFAVGCRPGTELFLGACWQTTANAATTAPTAALNCASEGGGGGALPEALQLLAFGQEESPLSSAGEWSSDIPVVTGLNLYGVVTVSNAGVSFATSADAHPFRCVYPLVG